MSEDSVSSLESSKTLCKMNRSLFNRQEREEREISAREATIEVKSTRQGGNLLLH